MKIADILEPNGELEFIHTDIYQSGKKRGISWQYDGSGKGNNSQNYRAYFLDGKMGCLSHSAPHGAKILTKQGVRKTTRNEHERLQTLPDNYTSPIEINKAKSAIGNGWTVDVIAHIFSFLPQEFKNG
jgi:DNA (cytosine-5)-methyltransferase 3A